MQSINILGTEYTIEVHKTSEDEILKKNALSGYCTEFGKLIVIGDMSEEEYYPDMTEQEQKECYKTTLRHEITHAFFNESGLSGSANPTRCSWAKNEEMIDWIAIQSPKIFKVFKELDII